MLVQLLLSHARQLLMHPLLRILLLGIWLLLLLLLLMVKLRQLPKQHLSRPSGLQFHRRQAEAGLRAKAGLRGRRAEATQARGRLPAAAGSRRQAAGKLLLSGDWLELRLRWQLRAAGLRLLGRERDSSLIAGPVRDSARRLSSQGVGFLAGVGAGGLGGSRSGRRLKLPAVGCGQGLACLGGDALQLLPVARITSLSADQHMSNAMQEDRALSGCKLLVAR